MFKLTSLTSVRLLGVDIPAVSMTDLLQRSSAHEFAEVKRCCSSGPEGLVGAKYSTGKAGIEASIVRTQGLLEGECDWGLRS